MSVVEVTAVAAAQEVTEEDTPTDKVRRVLRQGPLLLPTHKIARRAGLSDTETRSVLESLAPAEVVLDPHTMSWSNLGKWQPLRLRLTAAAN